VGGYHPFSAEVPQELAQRCFDLLPPDFQEIIVRHFNNR